MTLRRLRSVFSVLVVAVLATTQFAVPVCGMQAEDGGSTHHAAPAAAQTHGDASHAHAGSSGSPGHEGAHHSHDGGESDASGCLDMTLCVAPALGARPPIHPQAPASDSRLVPNLAESATSIMPRTLRRPPKSL